MGHGLHVYGDHNALPHWQHSNFVSGMAKRVAQIALRRQLPSSNGRVSGYLEKLVEGIAQVLFLNGQYALLQCLVVSAAGAAHATYPPSSAIPIGRGLQKWADHTNGRIGSVVLSWPWQTLQMR